MTLSGHIGIEGGILHLLAFLDLDLMLQHMAKTGLDFSNVARRSSMLMFLMLFSTPQFKYVHSAKHWSEKGPSFKAVLV